MRGGGGHRGGGGGEESPREDENKQLANLPGWGRAGSSLTGWALLESIFWCLWGQAALLSAHSTPPLRVGKNRDGQHQGERGHQRWGDPGSATSAQQVWMCEAPRAKAHTPLIPHPKSSSTFISHPNRRIWRHAQPDVRLLTDFIYPHTGRSLHFPAEMSACLLMGLCTHVTLPFRSGAF